MFCKQSRSTIWKISIESINHLPHLFCKRKQASDHNAALISNIPASSTITIEAIHCVSGNISPSLHTKILSKVLLDSSKTMGLQRYLVLGKDLPGELCLNEDTMDGLTNGAAGFIKKFDFSLEILSRCSIVWMEFDDDSIGKTWRRKYRHIYIYIKRVYL